MTRSRYWVGTAVYLVTLALATWLAGVSKTPESISIWYPPAAVTAGYLLWAGGWRGFLPAVLGRVGFAVLIVRSTVGLGSIVATALLVTLAYALAAEAVRRRVIPLEDDFDREPSTSQVGGFLVIMGVAAPLLAAVSSRLLAAVQAPGGFDLALVDPATVLDFAIGDAVAVVTLVPLAWVARRVALGIDEVSRTWWLQSGGYTVVTGGVVVGSILLGDQVSKTLLFPSFVPLVFAATRKGLRGAAVVSGVTAITLVALLHGGLGADLELTTVHLFLATLAAVGLLVGAASGQREALTRALERTNTELENARQAAEDTAADLDHLFERAATPTFVLDGDGIVLRANVAAQRLSGYSPSELTGLPLRRILDGVELASPPGDAAPAEEVEAELVPATGPRRTVRVLEAGLAGDRLRGTLVQLVDVTDQRVAETQLRRQRDALDTFSRRVAHDLRQPIATMLGFAELLQRGEEHVSMTREHMLDGLSRNATSAASLIGELLEDARSIATAEVQTDLASVMTSVQALLAVPLAERDLEVTFATELDSIAVPSTLVKQLLTNLIGNAVEHAEDATTISVTVTRNQLGARITVADDGAGVDHDPLDRSRADSGNRGLGLSLCRAIAQDLGGELWYEPVSPHGARFVAVLPLSDGQEDVSSDALGRPSRPAASDRPRSARSDRAG